MGSVPWSLWPETSRVKKSTGKIFLALKIFPGKSQSEGSTVSVVAHNISVSSCALSCHVGRSSWNLESVVTVISYSCSLKEESNAGWNLQSQRQDQLLDASCFKKLWFNHWIGVDLGPKVVLRCRLFWLGLVGAVCSDQIVLGGVHKNSITCCAHFQEMPNKLMILVVWGAINSYIPHSVFTLSENWTWLSQEKRKQ